MDPLRAFERALVARDLARSTRSLYVATARRFLEHLGETDLGQATAADVLGYLTSRRDAGLTAWRREASHLRAFFRALVEAGLVTRDPTAGLHLPRHRPAPLGALTEDATRGLLEAALRPEADEGTTAWALGLRDRAALELLFATGLRATEVCAVLVVDLDLTARRLRVRPVKRGKQRDLPLPGAALSALRDYLVRGRPLLAGGRGQDRGRFLLSARGRPLDRSGLGWLVRQVARRAGCHAYPHKLRRTLATALVRNGASVAVVEFLLGHHSLAATDAYLAVDLDDLRQAVDLLPAPR